MMCKRTILIFIMLTGSFIVARVVVAGGEKKEILLSLKKPEEHLPLTGRCRESPALQARMNRHNQKIIKFNFRDAPRCARGASLFPR
jgi:hypothetical protein